MYINPFLAGVLVTVAVEAVAIIIIAGISIARDNKKKGNK